MATVLTAGSHVSIGLCHCTLSAVQLPAARPPARIPIACPPPACLQGEPMPEMLQLHAWLEAHIPGTDTDPSLARISHGDYRCVFGRVTG